MPQFPGGKDSLNLYLVKNFRYPSSAKITGYSGKAILLFLIGTDGKAQFSKADLSHMSFGTNPVVSDSLTVTEKKELAESAVRLELKKLVNAMPVWSPAIQRGRKMKVMVRVPFRLSLL